MNKLSSACLKAILACACAATALSPLSALAATEREVIINDDDSSIQYSAGNANNGGWGSGANEDKELSEHWSNTPGATLSFTFTGSVVELYGIKAPNHLNVSVQIDDLEAMVADCYAANRTSSTLLFSSAAAGMELEDVEHTLTLTVLDKDQANPAAVNPTGISFTYARVLTATDEEEPVFEGFTVVDDRTTTTTGELFKIQYSDGWYSESGYPNLFYDGTDHYAYEGASWEMNFIGNKAEVYATKNPAHGYYDVYVDGVKQAERAVAYTSGDKEHQQLLFTAEGLEEGEHNIKMVLPEGGDNAGKAIQLDYVKVYHNEIAPTGIALDKTELTMSPAGTATLTASITPWVATNQNVVWTSSDESVATVEDGVVTAADITEKKSAVITAASAADASIKAEAVVTVDPAKAVASVYIGDEKLLDLAENVESLREGSRSSYTLNAWKNDTVYSKVIVASQDRDLNNVTVTPSVFVNENGTQLDPEAISVNWLSEIKANIGRGNSGAPVKEFPDFVGEGGAKDVAANDVGFAWVTVNVPADAEAGTYTGVLEVSSDAFQSPVVLNYTLEVVDLMQPDPNMDVQLWQHPFSVANYYLGLGSQPTGGVSWDSDEEFYFTEDHFKLMRSSMKEYASIGGQDCVANIVEEAWNHQSYYNDESMVKWIKKADGTWEFDYTWYDAWVEFMIDCGVLNPAEGRGRIKAYSMVPWNNKVQWFDEASNSWKSDTFTPGSQKWKDMWTPFLESYVAHSMEKGWFDITYVAMDERDHTQLEPTIELIKSIKNENGKALKISSCLNKDYTAASWYEMTDQIDDISINQSSTSRALMTALGERREKMGLNTTVYTCVGDYPGNFTISDPGDNYWSAWWTMSLKTDGYLKWAYDNYLYDMHGNITYRYWEPGDGWFIYPQERSTWTQGEEAGFHTTPRYEMLKKGIRDVSKAKYLLASDDVSDEAKAALQEAIDSMTRPAAGGNGYGSATYANAAARAQTMKATADIMETVEAAAAEAAAAEKPDVPVDEANKILLSSAVAYAEQIKADGGLEGVNSLVVKRFEDCLSTAKAVLENPKATQAEVDKAWEDLSNVIHMLDMKTDKTALAALIAQAEELNLADYKDGAAKDEFSAALQYARDVMEDETALTDVSIKAAVDRLTAAMAGLELKEEIDTSLLALLVSTAGAEDLSVYISAGQDEFKAALEEAKAILAAPASQGQVDASVSRLHTAYLNLRRKADESLLAELNSFVTLVESLNLEAYAPEKKAFILNAYNNTVNLLAKDEVSQEEAEAQADEVRKAKEMLEDADKPEEVNKDQLHDLINKMKDVAKDIYTEETYEAFSKALDAAEVLYSNADATQEEVIQAIKDLNDAFGALKLKEENKPSDTDKNKDDQSDKKDNKPSNTSKKPATAAATSMGFALAALLGSAGTFSALRKRKNRK